MDNRIIIIARRITSLVDPEINGIEKGEFFFCTSIGKTYYRDVDTGIITKASDLPNYFPTATFAADIFTLTFNSEDKLFLVNNETYMRFYATGTTTTDNAKIKIGGTSYPLCDANGVQLIAGAIVNGSMLEVVFDGTKFRLITMPSRMNLSGYSTDYGRVTV